MTTDTRIRVVHDTRGNVYQLGQILGEGGQGTVFRVLGTDLAVKLLRGKSNPSWGDYVQRLERVRRFPLENISLAMPLHILRAPSLGYVMEFLTDMVSANTLMDPSKSNVKEAKPGTGRIADPVLRRYIETGGLRRRLMLLARTAEILAQLHGVGLVYADLSPNNVYVSAQPDEDEVFLIDCDNLEYLSKVSPDPTFTQRYAAPELVRGYSGNTTLSDAFSFAVFAFEVLSLVHPFHGDMVTEGPPELEDKAAMGEFPWIEHFDDNHNSTCRGIDRRLVISGQMHGLFARCFEEGKLDPKQRPGVAEWSDVLYTAAGFAIDCPKCGGGYFFNSKSCPWCRAPRPALVKIVFHLFSPDRNEADGLEQHGIITGLMAPVPCEITFAERLISGRQGSFSHRSRLTLKVLENADIIIKCDDPDGFWLESDDKKRNSRVRPVHDSFPRFWRLHCGDADKLHRYITYSILPPEDVT